MNVIKFIYKEKEVDFEKSNKGIMVNATEMAKIFPNKRINDFLSNNDTKSFIAVCIKNGNSRFLNIKKESDLIISKQKSGTWMHRVLALKFAAWLDADFELWVFTTIDQIILGHYQEMKEATIEKIKAQKEWQEKRVQLIKDNPQIAEVFELELKVTKADKKRIKAMKAAAMQLKMDLFN